MMNLSHLTNLVSLLDLFSTEMLRYSQDSCGGYCERNIFEIQVRCLVVCLHVGRSLMVLLLDHEPRNFRIRYVVHTVWR